ncbi:hypothetical protein ACHAWC_001318, partial [Mediolabrus comicus]
CVFVWRLRAEELFDATRQQIRGRLGKIFFTQMEFWIECIMYLRSQKRCHRLPSNNYIATKLWSNYLAKILAAP